MFVQFEPVKLKSKALRFSVDVLISKIQVTATFANWPRFIQHVEVRSPQGLSYADLKPRPVAAKPGLVAVDLFEADVEIVQNDTTFRQFSHTAFAEVPQPIQATIEFAQFSTSTAINVATAAAFNSKFPQFVKSSKIFIPPLAVSAPVMFTQFAQTAAIDVPLATFATPNFGQFSIAAAIKLIPTVVVASSFPRFDAPTNVYVPKTSHTAEMLVTFASPIIRNEIQVRDALLAGFSFPQFLFEAGLRFGGPIEVKIEGKFPIFLVGAHIRAEERSESQGLAMFNAEDFSEIARIRLGDGDSFTVG